MWLPFHSVKSIKVEFLNQIRCLSIKKLPIFHEAEWYPSQIKGTFKLVEFPKIEPIVTSLVTHANQSSSGILLLQIYLF